MNSQKKLSLFMASLPLLTVIALGLASVLQWKAGMFIPLLGSIIVAAIVGKYLGFSWSELEESLVVGTSRALQAVFILAIVGAIIGSWMAGGVIPTLILYSLKCINPSFFIPAAAVVTAIVSVSTGTSFTSIATIGLALMATGNGLGFPPEITAAAIISGAYFGDKLSPLSDTTNLAPAMAGCTLFEHVGHMLWDTIPAFLIAVIIYYFVGIQYVTESMTQPEIVQNMLNGLQQAFVINPWLLLVPVVTIVLAAKKVPAIPSLVCVAVLGALCAVFVQHNNVGSILNTMTFGFKSEIGIKELDALLSRGGIVSMGQTILLLSTATALGGILEKIGALEVIVNAILKKVKSTGQLMLATLTTGLAVGFATGAQLLAIVLPARMFAATFKERNLHPKNLSRACEAVGTVGINLVPWSVPAMFAYAILGVDPMKYIPYLFFVFLVVIINAIYGFTGVSIAKIDPDKESSNKIA